jgi:K+ transporter
VHLVRHHCDRGRAADHAAPTVLLALNPLYAVSFMIHHGIIGFVTLGAVFLAVTGRRRSMPTSAISANGRSRPPGSSSCCRRWR